MVLTFRVLCMFSMCQVAPGNDGLFVTNNLDHTFTAAFMRSDNKVVAFGSIKTSSSPPAYRAVALFEPDGQVNFGFADGILASYSGNPAQTNILAITGVGVQTDGKFIVATLSPISRMLRMNTDGSLDPTFVQTNGLPALAGIAPQANGEILLLSGPTGAPLILDGMAYNGVARLHNDGSVDTSFNAGAGFNGPVTSAATQVDGKTVLAGAFSAFEDTKRVGLARLLTDGTLDTQYDPATTLYPLRPERVALQADGKAIVCCRNAVTNYDASYVVIRLLPNGTRDSSFKATDLDLPASDIQIQSDGKAVLHGFFSLVDNIPRRLVRLSTSGGVDQNFRPPNFTPPYLSFLSISHDDTILAVGSFRAINRTPVPGVLKLFSDNRSASFLNPSQAGDGSFIFSVSAPTGRELTVERSPNFQQWTTVTNLVTKTNHTEVQDHPTNAAKMFYRSRQ